jgi:5-methyltetrahydrofolate--homocysteine methyltransferase
VKSTLVMKENLEVLNERNLNIPVILGGAALTRRYVDADLRPLYKGDVYYANDAFDGLRYMEAILGKKSAVGLNPAPVPAGEAELTGAEAKIALAKADEAVLTESASSHVGEGGGRGAGRSAVKREVTIPQPPFWGTKVVDDTSLDDVFRYVNDAALIRGQWRVVRGSMTDDEYKAILEKQVYPDYENLKSLIRREGLLEPRAVYGYYPCQSEGNDLIVYETPVEPSPQSATRNPRSAIGNPQFKELLRFTFPRQTRDRSLCIADFFAPVDSGRVDVLACHLVTVGARASEYSRRLYDANRYKDYLYFHGLSVESAEAMAELFHGRIRDELGIAGNDATEIKRLFSQGYQGARYSFGYPACPNLEDQVKLFELLKPERIGVFLTEEYQMEPEQSTSAIIIHHPEARYFTI